MVITQGLDAAEAIDKTLKELFLESVSRTGTAGVIEALILFSGVSVLWFGVWRLMDVLAEGHAETYFKKVKFAMKIGRMKNHVIICGAGRVGSNIAKRLAEGKKKFLIIEQNEKRGKQMRNKGYIVMIGDCMDENALKEARVETASAVAAVVGATERNVYLTLTAKELNPKIKVHARANDEKIAKKLRVVGADHIVMPEVVGAKAIADRILKK